MPPRALLRSSGLTDRREAFRAAADRRPLDARESLRKKLRLKKLDGDAGDSENVDVGTSTAGDLLTVQQALELIHYSLDPADGSRGRAIVRLSARYVAPVVYNYSAAKSARARS